MLMALQGVGWYLALGLAAVPTALALRRLGVGETATWALSRPLAWTAAGYAGFLAGSAGLRHWWLLAPAILAVPLVAALRGRGATGWRTLGKIEAVGFVSYVAVALLRLPNLAISGTEKPMDLAILATLMRPGAFPPADPWLAGATLPYYYFGFVPWVSAARILDLAPDVAYNLLVPTIAAVTAQVAWALARSLGAPARLALLAPFLAVFGGTLDGWRQLLAGGGGQDLWASSRQITGAITEFPLFTFHLGDLHPHLLAIPLVLAALLAARLAAARGGIALTASTCLLWGAAAATNPWYAVPLGAAVALLLVAPEAAASSRGVLRRLALAVLVGVGGWLLFAPFWLGYEAPLRGVGLVTSPSHWDQLALYLGAMLAVPVAAGWELSWRWGGLRREHRQLLRAFWLVTIAVVASLTGSLGLGLAVALGGFFAAQVVRSGSRRTRPAWALALVPLGLLGAMELVYVIDPYGGEFYRMNTVFKASYLAYTLLAVLVPVFLRWLGRRRRRLALAVGLIAVASGLPQAASLAGRVRPPRHASWGGLGWMAGGEAAAARWLAGQPAGTVLVEGVGDAYSDAARLSAASGVPAVLGWENHERVWRGDTVSDELHRRRQAVETIYSCGRPTAVVDTARAVGANLIAVGSVERRLYGEDALAAVLEAGPAAFSGVGITLVRVGE